MTSSRSTLRISIAAGPRSIAPLAFFGCFQRLITAMMAF